MTHPEGTQKKARWYALDLELEAGAREAVEYALMEAGALGTETENSNDALLQVTGYFESTPNRELVRRELLETLRIYNLPSSSVREMNVRDIADHDWHAEWKKKLQTGEVGRLLIATP